MDVVGRVCMTGYWFAGIVGLYVALTVTPAMDSWRTVSPNTQQNSRRLVLML